MGLNVEIVKVPDLSNRQINEMLDLMRAYYENVTREKFEADLQEKDMVILLSKGNEVRGFSSQQIFSVTIDGTERLVIFSGDTVIDKCCWGSGRLPLEGVRLALSISAKNPDRNLFWLLTTKGYMTYRFLPVLFRCFYPQYTMKTPASERHMMNILGQMKSPGLFDPETGIIRAGEKSQRLRSGVAEITPIKRKDPHVSFFEKINPGYLHGDELVCLARCDENNLKPFILKRAKRS